MLNKDYTFGMFLGEELERRIARKKLINKIVSWVSLALACIAALVFLVWLPLGAYADSMLLQLSGRLPSPAHVGPHPCC